MAQQHTYIPRAAADITLIQLCRATTHIVTVALCSAKTHPVAVWFEAESIAVVSVLGAGAATHTATVHLQSKGFAPRGEAYWRVAFRLWRKCQLTDAQTVSCGFMPVYMQECDSELQSCVCVCAYLDA